jgi:hypothetical protein
MKITTSMSGGRAKYFDPVKMEDVVIRYNEHDPAAVQKAARQMNEGASEAYFQFKQMKGSEPTFDELHTGMPSGVKDPRSHELQFEDSQRSTVLRPRGKYDGIKASLGSDVDQSGTMEIKDRNARLYAMLEDVEDRETGEREATKVETARAEKNQPLLDRLKQIEMTQRFSEDWNAELAVAIRQAREQILEPEGCGHEVNRRLKRVDRAMQELKANRAATLEAKQSALMDQIVQNQAEYQALVQEEEPSETTPAAGPTTWHLPDGTEVPAPPEGTPTYVNPAAKAAPAAEGSE